MFSTLDPPIEGRQRRRGAFLCGLIGEALLIALVSLAGMLIPQELRLGDQRYAVVWLPPLTPPEKVVLHPPQVVRLIVPKLKVTEVPEPPAPRVAELEVPKIQRPVPPAPDPPPVLPTPTPSPTIVAPRPPRPKEEIAVRTGAFGGAPEPVTTRRRAEEVQTGGFGSPNGMPGRAQGGSSGNVPTMGSFGLPDGPGVGNGTGGSRGIQGVVASAGFGSGIASIGDGRRVGGSNVAVGGFNKPAAASPSAVRDSTPPVPAQFQPVEILSKPSPVYTDEGRKMGIQGEVVLSVVFQASGALKVLSVVKSLGHGLDQAAERAAAQIRFKPAERDSKPADFPATLRIQFRLADQST